MKRMKDRTVSYNTTGGLTAGNSNTGASNVCGMIVFTPNGTIFTCLRNTITGLQSTSTAEGTRVNGIWSGGPVSTTLSVSTAVTLALLQATPVSATVPAAAAALAGLAAATGVAANRRRAR